MLYTNKLLNRVLRVEGKIITNTLRIYQRQQSSATTLLYEQYGDPVKVLKKVNYKIGEIGRNEVLAKVLAASVNPVDVNTIQGKYPVISPTLPAVAGSEGVAEIVAVGPEVTKFAVGDRVISLKYNLGTWRTYGIFSDELLYKVPKDLDLVQAATLSINPCTAYRLLKDFGNLKSSDVVIQNGANSAAGQSLIQIARNWGLETINIVRDRPNITELKNFLIGLGASFVLTEEELQKTDLFKSGKVEKPKLALDCIGGKNASEILRHLQNGCPMVTYGGMSRQPVTVSIPALIFKNVSVLGFSIGTWCDQNFASTARDNMLEDIIQMMKKGSHKAPVHECVSFDNYKEAVENTLTPKGMLGKKYIIVF